MEDVIDKIYEYSLEEIMGERFGRYSKYIIQDRAIPDVRDGLKPVQRRILYGMYKDRNTYDHPYRKSAKTVGNVMGNYHPHGDSSIYDAMVRMSQWWKQNTCYIDMQGNNGSMDGDSPAAMRYTEARLSKISNELLKDLDRDTVVMAPNFDDTEYEPTVLPAKFPNLLVNGTMGISAGYATNIPPHNLGEVIDATIKRIDSPNCRLDTIMEIVKGPDFPTGGIVEGLNEIRKAYTDGRGRIIVKSKTNWEAEKGKLTLVVSEIPYEVNKANLVRKIDEIRIEKKIDGIVEVRDESAEDVRIAIDCKKDANQELILNYLLKNTDLQITYNFNMVAIVNRRPKQLGIIEILDAYIAHHKDVVLRRSRFDLEHAKARYHIVEGLIKCISILDEVIRVIRASKNKADAKENLVKEFEFTEVQAEAIVTLQLYRLTNTDVVALQEELDTLTKTIELLELILSNEEVLKKVVKDELRKIRNDYATPRKTEIKDEITEIKIDQTVMIPKEDVIVQISKDGYVKRTSLRSYQATEDEPTLKEGDYLLGLYQMNTLDTLLVFTNVGNYFCIQIHELPICVWKDLGKHISNIAKLDSGEEIISVIPVKDFDQKIDVLSATKNGLIKRTLLKEYQTTRTCKPISCIKLKDNDELLTTMLTTNNDIFVGTNKSYGLWYDVTEIPVIGLKAAGVKSINLKDDTVINVSLFDKESAEYIAVITDKGTGKRIKISDFEKTSRAKRGLLILREVKTNPYRIIKTFVVTQKDFIGIKNDEIKVFKSTEIPILDRYSTGSQIVKNNIDQAFISQELIKIDEEEVEVNIKEEEVEKKVSLKEIDDRLLTIDDFLNSED